MRIELETLKEHAGKFKKILEISEITTFSRLRNAPDLRMHHNNGTVKFSYYTAPLKQSVRYFENPSNNDDSASSFLLFDFEYMPVVEKGMFMTRCETMLPKYRQFYRPAVIDSSGNKYQFKIIGKTLTSLRNEIDNILSLE